MSTSTSSTEKTQQVQDLLDTTKNYERISFLKGVAGLYYRSGLALALGLFGLIILEGLRQLLPPTEVFYDKGLFGMADNFTITQVGIIIVVLTFLGDISFAFTRFITDQRYHEYLSQDQRADIVKKFSLGSVAGGVLIAVPTILLAVFGQIGEAQGWALMGLFLGGLFALLGRATSHPPTLGFGTVLVITSILIFFETIPGPYWMILMMATAPFCFLTAMASYLYAEREY